MKLLKNGIVRTLALAGMVAAAGAAAQAQVAVGLRVGPVAVYDNYVPACPAVGYIWTPGYYAGGVWVAGRWMPRDNHYVLAHRDRDYRFEHRGWDHERR